MRAIGDPADAARFVAEVIRRHVPDPVYRVFLFGSRTAGSAAGGNAICRSSRTCFRSTFRNGVIDNAPFWIDLTILRNYIVHTYNEDLADYLYWRLAEKARRFRAVLAAAAT